MKPWGLLDWLVQKSGIHNWSLIGSLNWESRSNAVWKLLQSAHVLGDYRFLNIEPLVSEELPETRTLRDVRRRDTQAAFQLGGGTLEKVIPVEFNLNAGKIKLLAENLAASMSPNIVVDVSCMPKRFFYPLMKILFRSPNCQNLLVAYSNISHYTREDLASNFSAWDALPLFGGRGDELRCQKLVISVGYMPMGLPDFIKDRNLDSLDILLPFPPGPPSFSRNWSFIEQIISRINNHDKIKVHRIDTRDMARVFDFLRDRFAQSTLEGIVFAPFGPKTHSLAMCLHSILSDVAVYYTQPKWYNPLYSDGDGDQRRVTEIYGYSIRHQGTNYYSLPSSSTVAATEIAE